jgi:hypothetical protein
MLLLYCSLQLFLCLKLDLELLGDNRHVVLFGPIYKSPAQQERTLACKFTSSDLGLITVKKSDGDGFRTAKRSNPFEIVQ